MKRVQSSLVASSQRTDSDASPRLLATTLSPSGQPASNAGLVRQARDLPVATPRTSLKVTPEAIGASVLDCSLRLACLLHEQFGRKSPAAPPEPARPLDAHQLRSEANRKQMQLDMLVDQCVPGQLSQQVRSGVKAAGLAILLTSEGLSLVAISAYLAQPSPERLQAARQEAVWRMISQWEHPQQVEQLVVLLRHLLILQPDLPFRLDADAIPPGESGRQLLHQVSLAFAAAGEFAPAFELTGACSLGIEPMYLPLTQSPSGLLGALRPDVLLSDAPHDHLVRSCIQGLGQTLVDLQQVSVQARQGQNTRLLRQTVLKAQLRSTSRVLIDALALCHQIGLPDKPVGAAPARTDLAHAEATRLSAALIAAGTELPHTLDVLRQMPPAVGLMQAARTEVLDLAILDTALAPQLKQLLCSLFQLAPEQQFSLDAQQLYGPDEDICTSWLGDRVRLLVEVTRQSGPLQALKVCYARGVTEPHIYEPCAAELFTHPVCRDLTLGGIVLQEGELLNVIEAQSSLSVGLQSLTLMDPPKELILASLFGQVLLSLKELQKLELHVPADPVEDHDDLSWLGLALISLPLKHLHLEVSMGSEWEGVTLGPYIEAVLEVAGKAECLPRWQHASLSWGDSFDPSLDLLHRWVQMLIASNAEQISLALGDGADDSPQEADALNSLRTQELLRQRQQPLEVRLTADSSLMLALLSAVFLPLPEDWCESSPDQIAAHPPDALLALSLVVHDDHPLDEAPPNASVQPSGCLDLLMAWVVTLRPDLRKLEIGLPSSDACTDLPLFLHKFRTGFVSDVALSSIGPVPDPLRLSLQRHAAIPRLDCAATRAFMSVNGRALLSLDCSDTGDVADTIGLQLDRLWPSRVLPLVSHQHLLSTVDHYNAQLMSAVPPGIERPAHPLQAVAELIRKPGSI